VQFTGEGKGTQVRLISNRHWALSALAAASAAALRADDTVYSVTPLHHPSALLMAVGAAIAAGSRLAMASGTDQDTFWEEVRRYGATHVSYTWTSLRAVADGPDHVYEDHHPIRAFFGSGMPPNLWSRLVDRFPGTRVLEFYASRDGEAILANVDGIKAGCVGRPLQGTTEVRLAAFDAATRRPIFGASGLARECAPGEPGLLLARSAPWMPTSHDLRGVFEAEDRWRSTGDIFTRDNDGDLWLIGNLETSVPVADRWVLPARLQTALYRLPKVDLAVAYPVRTHERTHVEAALTLLPGVQLHAADLSDAFRLLEQPERPVVVHVVKRIEVSTWARPLGEAFSRAGGPDPDLRVESWRLVPGDGGYEKVR
jgi:putative long chain acyl-CoA synthase